MVSRLRQFVGLLMLAALPLAAQAQIVFTFTFDDADGSGFNDNNTSVGADRRGALQSAANTLSSYFSSSYTANINFTVESYSTDDSTLASAGSDYIGSGNGFYKTDVQRKIQDGVGGGVGVINWNFFHSWDYDDSVAGGSLDFKSVAMHEILHAMGFASAISSSGRGLLDRTSGSADVWAIFDQFLTNGSGGRLVNTSAEYVGGGILTDGVSSDVYWDGAAGKAANAGSRVRIYSPATFEDGSSLSHLDTAIYGTNNFIMTHAVAPGQSLRMLSAIEIGMLTDLGYNMTAIPEPAAVALLFGAGALGLAAWRRRRVA